MAKKIIEIYQIVLRYSEYMCGICVIIHFDHTPVQTVVLQQMMASMKHRGPEDEDIFFD